MSSCFPGLGGLSVGEDESLATGHPEGVRQGSGCVKSPVNCQAGGTRPAGPLWQALASSVRQRQTHRPEGPGEGYAGSWIHLLSKHLLINR